MAEGAGSGAGFFSRVYGLVRAIPRGRVATYGQVARRLGVPRGARAVGWALRALHGEESRRVPWHRVVGAGGRISLREGQGAAVQVARLRAEGVAVRRGRVDLACCGLDLAQGALPTRGKPRRSRTEATARRVRASSGASGPTRP